LKKTIGILGGMGPLATCDLMNKIISRTDAACDQEHLHICVDCNTNIPDRTSLEQKYPLPNQSPFAKREGFPKGRALERARQNLF
jgi:aspartate racemase